MGKFTDQVVFITGASSGIGEALAREFASEGAKLVLLARRNEKLKKLAAGFKQAGVPALAIQGDVTAEGDLTRAVETAVAEFGGIDVAVANAGFGIIGRFEKLKLEDYRRQFETNIFGVLRTAYAVLPALKKSRGRLVLMGSVSGHISTPEASAYSMSKFAVHALAAALHAELAPSGVSVVLISPGFVRSEIRQLNSKGEVDLSLVDPVPQWIQMDTAKAARSMVRAIYRRQREAVVTLHGKLLVSVQRHLPSLVAGIFKGLSRKVRKPRASRRESGKGKA